MPRNKIVKFADKDIDVKEKKIGELEILVRELFPSTKGKLKNLDKALNDLELDWDLLYTKLPIVFPGLSEEDVKNAYMSDLEKLIGAFIDVNFFGLKKLMGGLMRLNPIISQQR